VVGEKLEYCSPFPQGEQPFATYFQGYRRPPFGGARIIQSVAAEQKKSNPHLTLGDSTPSCISGGLPRYQMVGETDVAWPEEFTSRAAERLSRIKGV
jgi:hypothetical protein